MQRKWWANRPEERGIKGKDIIMRSRPFIFLNSHSQGPSLAQTRLKTPSEQRETKEAGKHFSQAKVPGVGWKEEPFQRG